MWIEMMNVDLSGIVIKMNAVSCWIILARANETLAWSGVRWTEATQNGLPADGLMICNFGTLEEAELYCCQNEERLKKAIKEIIIPSPVATNCTCEFWLRNIESSKMWECWVTFVCSQHGTITINKTWTSGKSR